MIKLTVGRSSPPEYSYFIELCVDFSPTYVKDLLQSFCRRRQGLFSDPMCVYFDGSSGGGEKAEEG